MQEITHALLRFSLFLMTPNLFQIFAKSHQSSKFLAAFLVSNKLADTEMRFYFSI